MGKGVLDYRVSMDDLLRPDVNYERPRGGGKALLDLVGNLRGRRILDVGCGFAPDRGAIEARGATWIGVDLSGPGCTVVADVTCLPFRAGSFRGILLGSVLQLVPEQGEAMEEMGRVLEVGGKLFGYVPFLEPLHGMAHFHMTHIGLEYLLLSHGFQPERIFPAQLGVPNQLDTMFFPKSVPLVQPAVRALVRLHIRSILTLNRWSREILTLFRRIPPDDRRRQRRQYRLLLGLRYAVGFNFVAARTGGNLRARSGYRALGAGQGKG